MHKVSIITPTFNHQKFIKKTIESVMGQTHPNWEMIIIDDCSTDNTCQIIEECARNDSRIKPIFHQKNWGIKRLKDIYNEALENADGEFVAILEGDDFWPKEKLSRQLSDFQDDKTVASYGDFIMTDIFGYGIRIYNYNEKDKKLLNNDPYPSILTLFAGSDFFIMPVTLVIRKETLIQIGGFKNDIHYPFIDIPTILSLSTCGNFKYNKNILGYYRKHQNSSWFNFAEKTISFGRIEAFLCINNFIKNNMIKINSSSIKRKQISYLEYKEKNKNLSLFYHKVAFSTCLFLKIPLYILFQLNLFFYKSNRNNSEFAK